MKPTRSYLMGIGTGLILSAFLSIPFTLSESHVTSNDSSEALSMSSETPGSETEKQILQERTSGENRTDSNAAATLPENTVQMNQESKSSKPDAPESEIHGGDQQSFTIPKGAVSEQITDALVKQGFLASKKEFRALVKERDVASKFRAGAYLIKKDSTAEEILNQLMKPPVKE